MSVVFSVGLFDVFVLGLSSAVEDGAHFDDVVGVVLFAGRYSLLLAAAKQFTHQLLWRLVLHANRSRCTFDGRRHPKCVVKSFKAAKDDSLSRVFMLKEGLVMLVRAHAGTVFPISTDRHTDLLPQFLQFLLDGVLVVES